VAQHSKKKRGFKIEAVMRRDGDKAADYAKRHGISKYYTDADDLIEVAALKNAQRHRQLSSRY
jgi:predicted dehydrogenase